MTAVAEPQMDANVTSISLDSEFAANLLTLVGKHAITRVIETGTHIATGTTAIIAAGMEGVVGDGRAERESLKFITIEANRDCVELARNNLGAAGFNDFVKVWKGLSIPRSHLPTPEEIKAWTVDEARNLPIEVDHHESDRVYRYYAETAQEGPDDLLGNALWEMDDEVELVMLDSAGHIGFQEFKYVIANLRSRCFIALDDCFHVKHYRSLMHMLDSPSFDVRCVGREKFGYCIAEYIP